MRGQPGKELRDLAWQPEHVLVQAPRPRWLPAGHDPSIAPARACRGHGSPQPPRGPGYRAPDQTRRRWAWRGSPTVS